ncbi:ABC transporter ATP-binding protein [Mycoplasma sp. 21DD0573]|uniref:ABC transporter ATP-binding protein n=1 Tax=unclassified Mycoplasma TaxID=2683645 RepID=UPI002B1E45B8|nr:ABC transporter ATP-binding protein [Mycoplasma sp. 21DD0573]MEA4276169.1 ABC transporter ATP-binding protein [Mycoplasma sp. 21DD0573]
MYKMFKILPFNIKMRFFIGIIIVILNVACTMILPIVLSQFLPLLTKGNQEIYTITIFKNLQLYESSSWTNAFVFLLISILVLLALTAITAIASTMIIIGAGERASNFYRNALFAKYQKLSLKDISNLTTESLITRINDDVAVFWDFLVGASTSLVKAPLFIIVGLVFAFATDLEFTYSILAVIPLLLFVMVFISVKVNPKLKQNRKNLDAITKEVDETVNGARFIKANNLQEQQKRKFNHANNQWVKTEKNIFKFFAIGTPAFFGIVNFIVVLIYAIGKVKLDQNPNIDGEFIAKINVFIEYEFVIAGGIILFSQFLGSMFRAKISSGRIVQVLDAKYDDLFIPNGKIISQTNDVTDYSVQFKNVNFKYFDTAEDYAIKNINFKIPGGKTLGIIGPTGSGKSTIVNLLVNNMKYTQENGNILINGIEVRDINTHNLHKNVAIVYQDALLYSGTIKSNVLFAKPNATNEELQKALVASCARNFIQTFEDRENHKVEQKGKNLSGGQKQRISIARSLIIDPKILILDDSTSALDNLTTKQLIKNIKENYSCTTIIISQKINSIKHADNILVLENGKILDQGTHEQLLNSCQWYKDVATNQLDQ